LQPVVSREKKIHVIPFSIYELDKYKLTRQFI
jgi:hypothetical protein